MLKYSINKHRGGNVALPEMIIDFVFALHWLKVSMVTSVICYIAVD